MTNYVKLIIKYTKNILFIYFIILNTFFLHHMAGNQLESTASDTNGINQGGRLSLN